MPSAPSSSPFDDLLRELDELPPAGTGAPARDLKREEALRLLMEVSKQLENVAIKLDPTPEEHPLHGVSIPDSAKQGLQQMVVELMNAQKELNTIEAALTQEEGLASSDTEPTLPPTVSNPPPDAPLPSNKPVNPYDEPTHAAPVPNTAPSPAQNSTPPPAPAPSKLDEERAAFATYKAQWDAAFAADPTLRDEHPEVLAYYEQMERYFHEAEQFLQKTGA